MGSINVEEEAMGATVERQPAAIPLSVIGSRGTVEVAPAALSEAEGGVTLWWRFDCWERPLAITLTEDEARQLAAHVLRELVP